MRQQDARSSSGPVHCIHMHRARVECHTKASVVRVQRRDGRGFGAFRAAFRGIPLQRVEGRAQPYRDPFRESTSSRDQLVRHAQVAWLCYNVIEEQRRLLSV